MTMTQTADEVGTALQELVSRAIDVGIQATSPDGPAAPFVLAQVGDAIRMHRIVVSDLSDGDASMQAARELATSIDGIARAAYAWDGYVRLDGTRRHAILVLAQERGEDGTFVMCQPYAFDDGDGVASGEPVLLAQGEELLIDLPRAVSPHHDDWAPPKAPEPGPTSALRERLSRCRPDEAG